MYKLSKNEEISVNLKDANTNMDNIYIINFALIYVLHWTFAEKYCVSHWATMSGTKLAFWFALS